MKYTLSVFGVLLLMGVCSNVVAANAGQIRFSGQILEAACEVSSTSSNSHGVSERINVAPGVMVLVDTAHNACSNGILPFNARFQPLPSKASSVKATSSQGVVVITYL
ncbi:hypothetical protein SAMN05216598_0430 [Pseudomonas asplenii]|uniref:Type 1 fimbrial protein n=1 Tax=Pseudomonas asplenii TaxID=53407 RepID=A0A1H1P8C3_9PSED|nr:hypothetical protein [Pseudomonas asplenii]SDS07403.1 hypothetical protein SAMN05216598_0430 [Pseudomonas asplenii]